MVYCAVYGCNNSLVRQHCKGLNLKFHRFPKKRDLKQKWIYACQRSDKFNSRTAYICSIHFKECFRKKCLQQTLLPYAPSNWQYLTEDAVPTEHLPISKPNSSKDDDRLKRVDLRCRKRLIDELIGESSTPVPAPRVSNEVAKHLKLSKIKSTLQKCRKRCSSGHTQHVDYIDSSEELIGRDAANDDRSPTCSRSQPKLGTSLTDDINLKEEPVIDDTLKHEELMIEDYGAPEANKSTAQCDFHSGRGNNVKDPDQHISQENGVRINIKVEPEDSPFETIYCQGTPPEMFEQDPNEGIPDYPAIENPLNRERSKELDFSGSFSPSTTINDRAVKIKRKNSGRKPNNKRHAPTDSFMGKEHKALKTSADSASSVPSTGSTGPTPPPYQSPGETTCEVSLENIPANRRAAAKTKISELVDLISTWDVDPSLYKLLLLPKNTVPIIQ